MGLWDASLCWTIYQVVWWCPASLWRVVISKEEVCSYDTAVAIKAAIAALQVVLSSLELVDPKCREDLRLIQEACDKWVKTGN